MPDQPSTPKHFTTSLLLGRTGRLVLGLAALTILVWLAPHSAEAGGNQASGLVTDELMVYNGTKQGTDIGDFISDENGLDEPYRYFLEVGPDVDRLVVDIFDPDIVQGASTSEDMGDRDLLRSSEDTFAHYRLFDPNGNQVATRFGIGDGNSPVADNAWETFYDSRSAGLSGGDTFGDNFGTSSYGNDDGNQSFAGNWTEENENSTAGPSGGMLSITGGELVITNFPDPSPFTNKPGIYRQVDLSSYVAATLSFDWRVAGVLEDDDGMLIQASGDGGTTYTGLDLLDNFASGATSGSQTYDLTPYIASNTRIRFRVHDLYAGPDEMFFVDNLVLRAVTTTPADTNPTDGHWELVMDMSSDVYNRAGEQDELNAIGIRAHDGDSSSSGDEVNVYAHSFYSFGLNNNGGTRSHSVFPYVTEGCTLSVNDFDFDSGATDPDGIGMGVEAPYGSWDLTSRSGTFTADEAAVLSDNDEWNSATVSGWNSDNTVDEYGLWQVDMTISDFGLGNYAVVYFGHEDADDPDANGDGTPGPTASPEANTFRIYFPTDGDAAPPKPYVITAVRWRGLGNGPNPPVMGSTTGFTISIRVTNPAGSIGPITFNATNLVSSFIPDDTAQVDYTYVGLQPGFPTSGTVTEPTGTENDTLTWNPGTIAVGDSEILIYHVDLEPLVATDPLTIPVTGAYDTANGTFATFIDETGSSSDTITFSLCGLNVVAGATAGATPVLVSSFEGHALGNATVLEWTTAAEAGSSELRVLRHDERGVAQPIHQQPLLALLDSPQGGTYRYLDEGASPFDKHTYTLIETMASGRIVSHGPYTVTPRWDQPPRPVADGYERSPHTPGPRPVQRRVERPRLGQEGGAAEAVKVVVEGGGGLYRVTADELAPLFGMSSKAIQGAIWRHQLELSHGGQPVAYQRQSAGTALDFWAPAVDSPYGESAVYWLRFGDGLAMGRVPGDPPAGEWDDASFRETTRFEQNLRATTLLPLDPEGDIFFWDFVRAGDAQHGSKVFELELEEVADSLGTGQLTLHLQGAGEGSHTLDVELGGSPLGTAAVLDLEADTATLELPLALLSEGVNTLTLTATGGGLVFVDAVEVSYDRRYRATGDQLISRGDGNRRVAPDAFGDGQVRVFDLTNPRRPRRLEGVRVVAEPLRGSFRAIWEPSVPTTPYLAVAEGGVRAPAAILADQPSNLVSTSNTADYLVITTGELMASAQTLADHRTAGGLSTMVIDIEDIHDEFAQGQSHPLAIRDFLSHAYQQWATAPRYVVLAGAGTYDWADHLGLGGNLLPVPLASDGETLFATDRPFADLVGDDGVPEVALGRLPVLDATELDALIAKIIAYESVAEPEWGSQVMMLADNLDNIASYSQTADELGTVVPLQYQLSKVAFDDHPDLASTRQALFDGIDQGVALLEYLGHGGVDRMAAEGLMTIADVPSLTNADRLPLVLAVSCHIGFHGLPGFDALGEHLLLQGGGGAAAVIAPSWLSRHGEARLFADRLHRQFFVEGEKVLGDALLEALEGAAALGVDRSILDTYQLLGDPALELRLTPDDLPGGTGCGDNCGAG